MPKPKTWIGDLVIKRLAHRANGFILETLDMKRIDQMRTILMDTETLKKLFRDKVDFKQIIEYDLLRTELLNLKSKTRLTVDPMTSPLKELDNFLTGTPTVVLISYVLAQHHADALSDYLAAWSQDSKMHQLKSTVIVFTSDANLFNESLRRLCYTIPIVASTPEERKVLLDKVAADIKKGMKEKFGRTIRLKATEDIVQASSGMGLHPTETAAIESFYLYREFRISAFTEFKIDILQTHNLQYVEPTIDFSLVGGYKLLKDYIRNRVIFPLRNPETAKYYAVGLPKGIILYGYYGCGKTYISEAIAKELGLAMVKLSPGDLFRGIVGESEGRVRQITNLIESLAPVVVMIDERCLVHVISLSFKLSKSFEFCS